MNAKDKFTLTLIFLVSSLITISLLGSFFFIVSHDLLIPFISERSFNFSNVEECFRSFVFFFTLAYLFYKLMEICFDYVFDSTLNFFVSIICK